MAVANSGSSLEPVIPENLLSIKVCNIGSSIDGIDYEVILKTCLPCFRKDESTVRRTQQEFGWLCSQMAVKSFQVPFGETADPSGDMSRLRDLLLKLASDPMQQYEPALRCFLTSPIPIPSNMTTAQLQAEEDLLKDCTEDKLEDKSLEELRGICLRQGLSAIADYTDREYFLEKILMQNDRQLKSDLDVLENAMKSIQTGWMDLETNPAITDQPAAALSLPEIEDALASIEASVAADNALVAFEEPLPATGDDTNAKPLPPADLPEDLLRALENPYAAAMEEAAAKVT